MGELTGAAFQRFHILHSGAGGQSAEASAADRRRCGWRGVHKNPRASGNYIDKIALFKSLMPFSEFQVAYTTLHLGLSECRVTQNPRALSSYSSRFEASTSGTSPRCLHGKVFGVHPCCERNGWQWLKTWGFRMFLSFFYLCL